MTTPITIELKRIADAVWDEGLYSKAIAIYKVIERLVEPVEQKASAPSWVTRHFDALTLEVPHGYDTVLGYLAKCHPDVLDDINYRKPDVTTRDEWWLTHRMREKGHAPQRVLAPPCLRDQGIEYVNAYPISLLEQRWMVCR